MHRYLNLLLLIAAICGAVFAWRAANQHRQVHDEYKRRAAQLGLAWVEDEDKIQVVRIDTGDPLHFAWHILLRGTDSDDKWRFYWYGANHDDTTSHAMKDYQEHPIFPRGEQGITVRVRYRKIGDTWKRWTSDAYRYSFTDLGSDVDPNEWRFATEQVGELKLYDPATSPIQLLAVNQIETPSRVPPQQTLLVAERSKIDTGK